MVDSKDNQSNNGSAGLRTISYAYKIGLVLALLTSALYLLKPIAKDDFRSWNPGNLSMSHKGFEKDCAVCHTQSFERISDATCSACHKVSDHEKNSNAFKAHHAEAQNLNAGGKQCIDCHVEHDSKQAFLRTDQKLCVECHVDSANFGNLKKDQLEIVKSFDQHPEFSVSTKNGRFKLGDKEKQLDHNTLKLNHKIHLEKGLKGPDGPVDLSCSSCHKFTPDGRYPLPFSFEKDCRSCHPLTFDTRLPDSIVPHGNDEEVFEFLISEYAKFLKVDLGWVDSEVTNRQRLIGSKNIESENVSKDLENVFTEARRAEQILFTKTSCNVCHEVSEKTSFGLGSRYEITKPEPSSRWLLKANYDHSSHKGMNCLDCHGAVKKSEKTGDLLLPGVA